MAYRQSYLAANKILESVGKHSKAKSYRHSCLVGQLHRASDTRWNGHTSELEWTSKMLYVQRGLLVVTVMSWPLLFLVVLRGGTMVACRPRQRNKQDGLKYLRLMSVPMNFHEKISTFADTLNHQMLENCWLHWCSWANPRYPSLHLNANYFQWSPGDSGMRMLRNCIQYPATEIDSIHCVTSHWLQIKWIANKAFGCFHAHHWSTTFYPDDITHSQPMTRNNGEKYSIFRQVVSKKQQSIRFQGLLGGLLWEFENCCGILENIKVRE